MLAAHTPTVIIVQENQVEGGHNKDGRAYDATVGSTRSDNGNSL